MKRALITGARKRWMWITGIYFPARAVNNLRGPSVEGEKGDTIIALGNIRGSGARSREIIRGKVSYLLCQKPSLTKGP